MTSKLRVIQKHRSGHKKEKNISVKLSFSNEFVATSINYDLY